MISPPGIIGVHEKRSAFRTVPYPPPPGVVGPAGGWLADLPPRRGWPSFACWGSSRANNNLHSTTGLVGRCFCPGPLSERDPSWHIGGRDRTTRRHWHQGREFWAAGVRSARRPRNVRGLVLSTSYWCRADTATGQDNSRGPRWQWKHARPDLCTNFAARTCHQLHRPPMPKVKVRTALPDRKVCCSLGGQLNGDST